MSRPIQITLIVLAVVIVAVVLFFVFAPSQAGNADKFNRTFTAAERQLIDNTAITASELTAADGKDGHPAWIAIDGVVYDLTASAQWPGGSHHGHLAGRDLTEPFLQSGHGVGVLQKLTVIGSAAP